METAYRLILAAGLFMALGWAVPAGAADIYTVRGIHVDETAKSAADARTVAQAAGQRLALGEILKRLTLPEDWPSLPAIDDRTAQAAVRGFQVASEKTSATRYIADLNVSFQPDAVRQLLRSRNIAFGETQAKPAVLLAVFEKSGAPVLWEEQNPWRDAWSAADIANAMTPLIVPLGDVEELALVTAAQARNGDKAALAGLAARYGTDGVVVADAVANADGTRLDVTVSRYGAEEAAPVKLAYQGAGGFDTLAKSAAAGVLATLSEQWKRQIIVHEGEQAQLTASVFFSDIGQWEAIRKGLARTPLVLGLQVEGISPGGAEVAISYKGSPDKLALSLAQANIVLAQDHDGWSLRLR